VRRRSPTRWALIAAVTAVAACFVSPVATTASFAITPGGPAVVVTVNTAGTTSQATFHGTVGQRVSLNITNVTITSTKVSFLKPDGTNLVTPFTVLKSGYYLDVRTLPATGTYKIVVDPKYDYVGKMTLRLYDVPPDPSGVVVPGGAAVPVATTTPGQNATLTFDGTVGHRISVNLTDSTYTTAKLRIYNPDSSLLYPTALTFGVAGNFLEPKTLPSTGTYTLQIDPVQLAKGTVNVQVFDVPDDAGGPVAACTSLPCAPPTTVTTTTPGQNGRLTFSGLAGQRVAVLGGSSTYLAPIKLSILKPDLTALATPITIGPGVDGFTGPKTLPADGVYTVLSDPHLADTGSLDVTLYTVPADVTGTITPGTPLTVPTMMPGQNALFTFTGAANQRVSLNLTNVTYGSAKVSILKPDLTELTTPLFVPNTVGNFQEPVKLPVSGTYTVKVDPQGAATGSVDVSLYIVPADVTGALTAGVLKNVSITTPGQNAVLTYAGTSGQRIFIDVLNVTLEDAKLRVTRPDGTNLQAPIPFGTAGTYVENKTLNQTGTYKVWIDPTDELTGSLDVVLYVVPADVTGTLVNGVAKVVTTTTPGQNAAQTFSATNGQRIFLKVSNVSLTGETSPSVRVKILKPDGLTFASIFNAVTGDDYIDTKTVTASGTYKVVVDPQGRTTGSVTLTYYVVPSDLTGVLAPSLSPNFAPGQNATYTFAATAGQAATLTVSGSALSLVKVELKSPTGTTLDFMYWDTSGGSFTVDPLPETGTYSVLVNPVGAASGSLTLTKS
jgi:hypothetical protein